MPAAIEIIAKVLLGSGGADEENADKLPKTDNLLQSFGVNVSGAIAPAVADGYFAFIPGNALPPGNYVLEFGGSEPFVGSDGHTHTFSEQITYHITVTE